MEPTEPLVFTERRYYVSLHHARKRDTAVRTLAELLSRKARGDHPERRVGFSPVPNGMEYLLTEAQADCLGESGSRLSIAFVRSQGRVEPLIVVRDHAEGFHGILSDEGIVYQDSDLRLRT